MTEFDLRQMVEYQEERKSLAVAYILWGILGPLGGHRFYLRAIPSGLAQLILTLTIVGLFVTVIWWVVDAFLLPGMAKSVNREIFMEINRTYGHGRRSMATETYWD